MIGNAVCGRVCKGSHFHPDESPVDSGVSFHASDIKTCMIMLSIAFRVAVDTYNRKSKQNGSMC